MRTSQAPHAMTTATREKAIGFRREMREAIEAGRKTQTRRIVTATNSTVDGWKFRGSLAWENMDFANATARDKATIMVALVGSDAAPIDIHLRVPHKSEGSFHRVRSKMEPGDILWVKEGRFTRKADARLWLEVTAVRVERVQDISEADAIAEGIPHEWHGEKGAGYLAYALELGEFTTYSAQIAFPRFWDRIHGPGAWERNDWVWAYTFRRIAP